MKKFKPVQPHARPECPDHLKGEARQEWDRIVAEIERAGKLTDTDRSAIALYCEQYRIWFEATAKVNEQGIVVKLPNGWPGPNPFLPIANKATAQMARLLAQFHLTPASRAKDKPKEDKPEIPPLTF